MARWVAKRVKQANGRLGMLGHDYDEGHRKYVERLPEGERAWLWTKPFSAPPTFELADSFHTFAHVVRHLNLGLGARILDVGCGPGWLSEFLARCGYHVTGIDISEDMVEIARGRVARIPRDAEGMEPVAEFHALAVREIPWTERFDAAILYDTMHHFDEELETLRMIRRALVPGGFIYIREGAKPDPGSETEQQLIDEMRQHETLESPFDPAYMVRVIEDAGFEDVRRFLAVDELVDLGKAGYALGAIGRFLRFRFGRGDMTTVIARNGLGAELPNDPQRFSARLESLSDWHDGPDWDRVRWIGITNTGEATWGPSGTFPFPDGTINLGPYYFDENGTRHDLGRSSLPRAVWPGETVQLMIRAPREIAGARVVSADMVREGLGWFSQFGGEPLVFED